MMANKILLVRSQYCGIPKISFLRPSKWVKNSASREIEPKSVLTTGGTHNPPELKYKLCDYILDYSL